MKTKVAVAVAIVLFVVAVVGTRAWFRQYQSKLEQEKQPYLVLAAARNLAAGTELLPEHVVVKNVDARSVPYGVLLRSDQERYRGRKLTRDIRRGDMLQATDFWQPQVMEDFENNAIAVGERAITVPVDQISGVAGLILPNSRVDVLATFAVPGGQGGMGQTNFVTRTLLSKVRVLAIDRVTAGQGPIGPDQGGRRSGTYSSVTLAVSPLEAQIITLARSQTQGMLTLVLRNPVDAESSVSVRPVDGASLDDAIRQADEERNPSRTQQNELDELIAP